MRSPVAVRRVFKEFQRHVDPRGQHVELMTEELVQDANYFKRSEEPSAQNGSRETLFHRRRLEMDIGAFWPLLFNLRGIGLEQPGRDRCFAILESYFVRRLITGYQARSYDRVALELLNVLSANGDTQTDFGDRMLNHLLGYSEAATLWPTDTEVEYAVLNRRLPAYAQRLVLTAVEEWLITNRAGVVNLPPSVQIEHIMPRGWQPESWPLPNSTDPTTATEKRSRAIQTLGNLTLLNGQLNAALSNSPWATKRKEIQKSDNLFLNRRLLEQASDNWIESDIFDRGHWMYKAIVEIWPRG